jgi:hypothetical protein
MVASVEPIIPRFEAAIYYSALVFSFHCKTDFFISSQVDLQSQSKSLTSKHIKMRPSTILLAFLAMLVAEAIPINEGRSIHRLKSTWH